MDRLDHETTEVWRVSRDMLAELLADLAAGRTKRAYSAAEIAEIQQEHDRQVALILAYEAARDAGDDDG